MASYFDLPSDIVEVSGNEQAFSKYQNPGLKRYIRGQGLLSNGIYYKTNEDEIFVWDISSGISTNFLSAQNYGMIQLNYIVKLTSNHLFVMYKVSTEIRISIIFLDWNEGKYTLIGDSRCFLVHEGLAVSWVGFPGWVDIYQLSCNMVGVKVCGISDWLTHPIRPNGFNDETLYIYKVNDKFSNFELYKSVSVPKMSMWFGMTDDENKKLVFALSICEEKAVLRNNVKCIMFLNKDGSFTTIENSAISPNCRAKHCFVESSFYEPTTQTQWQKNMLFVLYSVYLSHPSCGTISASFTLFSFDLNQSKWLEIRLKAPKFDQGFFDFSLDNDGILIVINSVEDYYKCFLLNTTATSYRIPIGKPEKLTNILLFHVKRYKMDTSIKPIFICAN